MGLPICGSGKLRTLARTTRDPHRSGLHWIPTATALHWPGFFSLRICRYPTLSCEPHSVYCGRWNHVAVTRCLCSSKAQRLKSRDSRWKPANAASTPAGIMNPHRVFRALLRSGHLPRHMRGQVFHDKNTQHGCRPVEFIESANKGHRSTKRPEQPDL